MGKNIGEKLFSHVKPMGVLGIFNGDLQKIVHSDLLYFAGYLSSVLPLMIGIYH